MNSVGLTRKATKSARVYDVLLQKIVNGELPPGSPLEKSALAIELGVSRQPLDTAIERLATEGLVVVFPQHGSFVARIEEVVVSERFLVRRALEVELVLEAVASISDGWMRQLDANLQYQRVALENGDLAELFRHDIEFHALIHRLRNCSEALSVLRLNDTYLRWVRRFLLPAPGRAEQTIAEHQAIRDALASGDGETAAKAMRHHLIMTERQFSAAPRRAA